MFSASAKTFTSHDLVVQWMEGLKMVKNIKAQSKLVKLGSARTRTKGINGQEDENVLGGRFN